MKGKKAHCETISDKRETAAILHSDDTLIGNDSIFCHQTQFLFDPRQICTIAGNGVSHHSLLK